MKKPYQCSDGFCGGDDCKRCRPDTYWRDDDWNDRESAADDEYGNIDEKWRDE